MPIETVRAIEQALPGRYRALVTLAAGTGLRQGECLGPHRGSGRLPAPCRDAWTNSSSPCPAGAVPGATEDGCERAHGPAAAGCARRAGGAPGHVSRPMGSCSRTSAAGRSAGPRSGRYGAHAVAAAGAPHGTGFHDLRHFYASLLIRHGESVKVVQARLGHASAAETLDTLLAPVAGQRRPDSGGGRRGSSRGLLCGLRRWSSDITAGHGYVRDELACKPDSVARRSRTGDHPSRTTVADGLVRSTRELGRAALERSLYDLAPGGVCRAARVTPGAGGLLHRRFTLAERRSARRSAFCGTVPRVAPGGRYPPPCPVESGLSSAEP